MWPAMHKFWQSRDQQLLARMYVHMYMFISESMSRLKLSTSSLFAFSKARRLLPNTHSLLSRKKTTSAVPLTSDRFNVKRGDYAEV